MDNHSPYVELLTKLVKLAAEHNVCVQMLESAEAECAKLRAEVEILKALRGDPEANAENAKKVDLLRHKEERGE